MDDRQRDLDSANQPQYYLRRPIIRPTRNLDNRPIHPSPPVEPELVEESNEPIHPSPPVKPEPVAESLEPIHPSPPIKPEQVEESGIPIHPSELTMPPLPRPEELEVEKPKHNQPKPNYSKITDLRQTHAGPLVDPMVPRTHHKPLAQPVSSGNYPGMHARNELGDIASRIDNRLITAKATRPKVKLNFKLLAIPLVITVLIAAAIVYFVTKASSPHYTAEQVQQAKVVSSLEKTPEYRDASIIGAGMNVYKADNGGVLPKALAVDGSNKIQLCGQTCQGSTETVTVGPLNYYTSNDVTYITSGGNLSVKDTHTLYIVPNASCSNTKTDLISTNSSGSSAILYATSASSGITQQCLEV